MPDQINDAVVESVLSAVRRLVADNQSRNGATASQRLVLTPALRVEPKPLPTTSPALADPLVLVHSLPMAAVSPVPPQEPEPGPADSIPDAATALRPEEPAVPDRSAPDDAALRAMVAEALHHELGGELGERLTRNLRKLVRQEVMQALAMRDLR